MSNFLSLLPKIVFRSKKRLGRGTGSGKGIKSGRGTTRHQKARGSIPLHFEGGQGRLVKRFPLLRGKGKNSSKRANPIVIALSQLNVFSEGATITTDSLMKKGFLTEADKKLGVKIIKNGKLEKKLTIQVPVTHSVKSAVEKLGGTVEV